MGDILFTYTGRSTIDRASSLGVQAEGSFDLGEAHTLRAGLVIISDIARGRSLTLALPIDVRGAQIGGTVITFASARLTAARKDSLFVRDEFRASDNVTLNLGRRVDHLTRPAETTRFSPHASFVWKPDAETTVHLGYAR